MLPPCVGKARGQPRAFTIRSSCNDDPLPYRCVPVHFGLVPGLAAAPSAFAAGADATTKSGETKTQAQHKHHKSDKTSAKQGTEKSGAAKMDKSGTATAPAK